MPAPKLDLCLLNVSKSSRAETVSALAKDIVFVRLSYHSCNPPDPPYAAALKSETRVAQSVHEKLECFFPELSSDEITLTLEGLRPEYGPIISTMDVNVRCHAECTRSKHFASAFFQVTTLNMLMLSHILQTYSHNYPHITADCCPLNKDAAKVMQAVLSDMSKLVYGGEEAIFVVSGLEGANKVSAAMTKTMRLGADWFELHDDYLGTERDLPIWELQLRQIKDMVACGLAVHHVSPLIHSIAERDHLLTKDELPAAPWNGWGDPWYEDINDSKPLYQHVPATKREEANRYVQVRLKCCVLMYHGLAEFLLRQPNTGEAQRHPSFQHSGDWYDWEWKTRQGLERFMAHVERYEIENEVKALVCAAFAARAKLYVALARKATLPKTIGSPDKVRDGIHRAVQLSRRRYVGWRCTPYLDHSPQKCIAAATKDIGWAYKHAGLVDDEQSRSTTRREAVEVGQLRDLVSAAIQKQAREALLGRLLYVPEQPVLTEPVLVGPSRVQSMSLW